MPTISTFVIFFEVTTIKGLIKVNEPIIISKL